ncbi:MAG: hypothetical protein CW691_04870 [Candidatus Bathyarchaeum sp.]|nr:MAG: hypothetical protein CW691_04870 [Candidatus Bathyarchaeum sp.]
MNSKDLVLIIVLAVLQFVVVALVVQMGKLVTGVPGTSYLFTILLAIPTTFSLLIYEGRRWRFFIQMSLYTLLIIPTHLCGTPFDPISRLSMIANSFLGDVLANSTYGIFNKHNKLFSWSIIMSIEYWIMNPFFGAIVKQIFYSPEVVEQFVNVVLLLLPVIIVEAVAGGYMGYKIYKKVRKIH